MWGGQTAVSHGYIVSIAPCLDNSSPSSSKLHISVAAAESEMNLSKLPELTCPDDDEELL